VRVAIRGQPIRFEITVPTAPTRLRDLLPVFQGLADAIVEIGARSVEREGQVVSCRKGCGACCRQPVPISESEAQAIRGLVNALPEPRRSAVRERFDRARVRLAEAGLLEPFEHPVPMAPGQKQELAIAYFRLGLACPFLEDESCSIHADRPVACREYLVSSPAVCCAQPTPATVRVVPLPAKVSTVLRAMDRPASPDRPGWLALAAALGGSEADLEERPLRPGPAWVEEFFRLLANLEG
jgi:Fe-S-cluster containining protein